MNMFYSLGAILLEGDTGLGVSKIMTGLISDMKSEYLLVVPAALGLSGLFWACKMLWNKFKSLAK